MTYRIELTTRDGVQFGFDCAPEQKLLDAAFAAQLSLPSVCRQGSCGACHASVTAGDYDFTPSAPPADGDAGQNILLCCTHPRSDLQVALPYNQDKVLRQAIPQRSATIVCVEPIAEQTARLVLRLAPDPVLGSAAEFEPGQYMTLEIPDSEDRRAYSLANTGNWDGLLEFLIRIQPNGRFSTFLSHQAKPGMTLQVRGPQGAFGVDANSLRPRWLVAGGTGLAPMLSILRRMAEYQEPQEVRLFFGVNREGELFALDELQRLQAELPQLRVDLCVWKPQTQWSGFTGTPADALQQALQETGAKPDLYLCGPAPLLDAAERVAAAAGVPAEQLFSERFLPS